MADETAYCTNPDCNHARIGHFAPNGCMMPGCKCNRTYGNEDVPPGTTPAPAPAAAPLPTSSTAAPGLVIPADCIVSPCKVSAGRFVPVIVPLHLSKSEANRLIAFILAQTDDAEPPELPEPQKVESNGNPPSDP